MSPTMFLRKSALVILGCVMGILMLALAPVLLRQTSFDTESLERTRVRLLALQEEELPETKEIEPEPEPPPEPEILPEPPDVEPPEIDVAQIEPPQTTYESAVDIYEAGIQLPNLTGLGLKGVRVSPQNLSRNLSRAPMPGLPKHGDPRTRFNADEVDRQPQGVATMQPIYPYRAKRLGIEGYVTIRFLVNSRGKTDLLEIIKSVPPGQFESSVEKSVARWNFKPAIKNGNPVETWVETTIEFKLN